MTLLRSHPRVRCGRCSTPRWAQTDGHGTMGAHGQGAGRYPSPVRMVRKQREARGRSHRAHLGGRSALRLLESEDPLPLMPHPPAWGGLRWRRVPQQHRPPPRKENATREEWRGDDHTGPPRRRKAVLEVPALAGASRSSRRTCSSRPASAPGAVTATTARRGAGERSTPKWSRHRTLGAALTPTRPAPATDAARPSRPAARTAGSARAHASRSTGAGRRRSPR